MARTSSRNTAQSGGHSLEPGSSVFLNRILRRNNYSPEEAQLPSQQAIQQTIAYSRTEIQPVSLRTSCLYAILNIRMVRYGPWKLCLRIKVGDGR